MSMLLETRKAKKIAISWSWWKISRVSIFLRNRMVGFVSFSRTIDWSSDLSFWSESLPDRLGNWWWLSESPLKK